MTTTEREDNWDEDSLRELIVVLASTECVEYLLAFGSRTNKLRISLICSDVFYWGTADAEEVEPDDIAAISKAYADLLATERKATWWTAELYAARKRGMRPQGPWYGYSKRAYVEPDVEALFDACGPERADSPKIPRPTA